MAVLERIALEPAAAATALRKGAPDVSRFWDALLAGDLDAVRIGRAPPPPPVSEAETKTETEVPPATVADGPSGEKFLLPGSFNPIHEGHRRMLATAAARLGAGTGGGPGARDGPGVGNGPGAGAAAAFELAIVNPDKPPLSAEDAAARLARFAGVEAVWLTRAPTFPEKARIFPGTTFAVGVDTIVRIAEPRYYGGPAGLAAAISTLGACRFLVFGRRAGPRFETLESTALPEALRALCHGVSEAEFRADISSTELRRSRDS